MNHLVIICLIFPMNLMFVSIFFSMVNAALYSTQYSQKNINKIKENMASTFNYAHVSLSLKMKISLVR